MNQINLDSLLQLPTAARPDTAPIKLVVAEFYQGQLQQLGAQSFRLQLPSAQGPLQLALPQQASSALQQLMPASAALLNQAQQTTSAPVQTSRILNTAIREFTTVNLTALTAAQISNLPPAQIPQFSAQQLASLQPEQLAGLNNAQLQQLMPQQTQSLSSTQLSALTPAQLKALNPLVLQSFSSAQLKQLAPAQLLVVQSAIPSAAAVKQAVTVQFEPQANGNIGLKIQPAQQALQFSLSPAVLRQILISAYSSEVPSTPVLQQQNQSALLLGASLQLSADTKFIRLPELPALPLSKTAAANLTQWLKHSTTSQLTVLLQLQSQGGKLVANVQLPSQESANPPLSLLDKPQQLQLTQQIVKWFNQSGFRSQIGPPPTAPNSALPPAATLKPVNLQLHSVDSTVNLQFKTAHSPLQQAVSLPVSHPHQLTLAAIAQVDKTPLNLSIATAVLQIKDDQSTLQLQPSTPRLQLSLPPQAANRELQFLPVNSQIQTTASVQPAAPDSSNIQQAWRHLLPLLPAKLDPLQIREPLQKQDTLLQHEQLQKQETLVKQESLQKQETLRTQTEQPPTVLQVLKQLRLSQPGAQRTLSNVQLMQHLQSVLQFQPLQAQPNIQTAGGSLAVAIQLLLGQLMQKPAPAALQPANQKLAQLVANLEPAQASSVLRQLSGYSSAMQQSQLATLDSSSAATPQQLILQLPLHQNNQTALAQIQLEQREAGQDAAGKKQTLWQLTMRFDLQQLGPLLVVAKLQHEQLHLQLYTEQLQTKQQADKFLPLLQERCTMQGLTVTNAECTLGKIPDSLLPRANSLLAIKV